MTAPIHSNEDFHSSSPLMDAVSRSQIVYDYFPPAEIKAIKETYYNGGSQALKGLIHSLDYNPSLGLYTAHAALGNVAAHDNIRVVAGGAKQFGYKPPETFAHDFGGVYTKYYPRVDKTESNRQFDLQRPNATFEQFEEGEVVSEALALRLSVITTALARSILFGIRSADTPLKGSISKGLFVPQIPIKRGTKSEYKINS